MTKKTLFLLRHAKSSWDDPDLEDVDRPLNRRGRKAAVRMGRLLRDESFQIDVVLCSTAVRTRETAELVFDEIKNRPPISFHDDLYHATPDLMVGHLTQITEPTRCAMVIGHNPGLEELLAQFTGNAMRFPTAALARLELDANEWSGLCDTTRGSLARLWRPKELDVD